MPTLATPLPARVKVSCVGGVFACTRLWCSSLHARTQTHAHIMVVNATTVMSSCNSFLLATTLPPYASTFQPDLSLFLTPHHSPPPLLPLKMPSCHLLFSSYLIHQSPSLPSLPPSLPPLLLASEIPFPVGQAKLNWRVYMNNKAVALIYLRVYA